jgi:predicted NUDIX family phosphoesterase
MTPSRLMNSATMSLRIVFSRFIPYWIVERDSAKSTLRRLDRLNGQRRGRFHDPSSATHAAYCSRRESAEPLAGCVGCYVELDRRSLRDELNLNNQCIRQIRVIGLFDRDHDAVRAIGPHDRPKRDNDATLQPRCPARGVAAPTLRVGPATSAASVS